MHDENHAATDLSTISHSGMELCPELGQPVFPLTTDEPCVTRAFTQNSLAGSRIEHLPSSSASQWPPSSSQHGST